MMMLLVVAASHRSPLLPLLFLPHHAYNPNLEQTRPQHHDVTISSNLLWFRNSFRLLPSCPLSTPPSPIPPLLFSLPPPPLPPTNLDYLPPTPGSAALSRPLSSCSKTPFPPIPPIYLVNAVPVAQGWHQNLDGYRRLPPHRHCSRHRHRHDSARSRDHGAGRHQPKQRST